MAYATSQIRRDVSTNWNPTTVLLDGELGFESDTGKLKVGYAGITWGSLAYTQGDIGATGATGDTGPKGDPGVSGGLVLYMDTAGGVGPQSGTISRTANTTAQTTIVAQHNGNDYLVGTFLTPVDFLTSTTIAPGFWDMNLFALSNGNIKYYFDIYSVDSNGTSNATLIAAGSTLTATSIEAQAQYTYSLYVPLTTLADLTKRIRVRVYGSYSQNKTLTIEFRSNTVSHLHTTLQQTVPQGATGATGVTGVTGVTGQSISYLNSIPSSGQFYESLGVSVSANTNTQLTTQSVTVKSTTTKVLIMAQATISLSAATPIYGTIGRYTSAGPTGATTNLSRTGIDMTTALNASVVNRMWGQSSGSNQTTVCCSVIDTPGVTGTFWYSLWVYTAGTATIENGTIIILQVAP